VKREEGSVGSRGHMGCESVLLSSVAWVHAFWRSLVLAVGCDVLKLKVFEPKFLAFPLLLSAEP
jgi:hypothetical protein